MLSDSQLMKLCLTMSVIGIIALFFIIQSIEPLELSVPEITQAYVGREVITSGDISSFAVNDGNIFIDLVDVNSTISVIMFKKDADVAYAFKKGDKVSIIGKVAIYRNELEIIASSIKKI